MEKFLVIEKSKEPLKEITNMCYVSENIVGVFSLDCLNLPRKLRKGQKSFHVPYSDYSLQYPNTVCDALCQHQRTQPNRDYSDYSLQYPNTVSDALYQIVNRIRKQELLLTKNTILYWCVLDQNMKIYSGEKKLKCFSF